MYNPPHFSEQRAEHLYALMRTHPLATVVVADAREGLVANHLPWLVDAAQSVLLGHVARANPLWRLAGAGCAALSVFLGPQAYVSPAHYPSKRAHGQVVPTWNYVTVHAHGTLRARHEPDWLEALVGRLTDQHEAGRAEPWSIGDAPRDYLAGMLGAIVGLEFSIERLEGKFKLSQNRDAADRQGVVDGLDGTEVGTLMAAAERDGFSA